MRKRVAHTLYYDDDIVSSTLAMEGPFLFSREIEKQHSVVYAYLGLQQTVETLKDCEYYFRRYPFRGLPVSHASHITNVCEMYFGRFYEFKERLKKYFKALEAVSPNHNLDVGRFIRQYDKTFDDELRARHGVHHHGRFQDLSIDRVFLVGAIATRRSSVETEENRRHYRKLTKEWVRRVRRRAKTLDGILEAVSDATLRTCRFLALYSLIATIAEYRALEFRTPKTRGRDTSARKS